MANCPAFLLAPDSPAPSRCFVLDAPRLRANAAALGQIQRNTGAKILLALKAFAAFPVFPLLSQTGAGTLAGVCASSVDEARLGREEFGGEVHAFAAAWSKTEMAELAGLCDHITFNSLTQWRQFQPMLLAANAGPRKARPVRYGFRVNPEHSEGAVAIYNPCAPGSRLGIRPRQLAEATEQDWQGITGLHFHTLCEQNADALARTLLAFEEKFSSYIQRCQWLNFGGGHHITRADYDLPQLQGLLNSWHAKTGAQIYLEPGEAVALNAGWLVATVLDVAQADMPIAILDVSAACHMPDVLEMPYRPDALVWHDGRPRMAAAPGADAFTCRLAGNSCLAGDVIGEYAFPAPLKTGQRLVFADMAIYSMVKTNTFNGLRLPSIAVWDNAHSASADFRVLRTFGYEDFRMRLG